MYEDFFTVNRGSSSLRGHRCKLFKFQSCLSYLSLFETVLKLQIYYPGKACFKLSLHDVEPSCGESVIKHQPTY